MTNTRITDPEILECRYPVILQTFSLRPGSGGKGTYCGGDGVVRKLQFRAHMTLSVLTERRVFAPYGIEGSTICTFTYLLLNGNEYEFSFKAVWFL